MYDRKLVGIVNVTVYVPGGSTGGLHDSPLGQLDWPPPENEPTVQFEQDRLHRLLKLRYGGGK
jgi:hypothetical protein